MTGRAFAVVEAVGFGLVLHYIAVGVAPAHHAFVEFQIEIIQINQTAAQIVQTDLAEGADEQTEHAQRGGTLGVMEHLRGEKQQGALRAATVAVDESPDAVARGFELRHGIVAVLVEDHAQKTVNVLVILLPAVENVGPGLGRTGVEVCPAHVGEFQKTAVHFTADVGVKTFGTGDLSGCLFLIYNRYR